MRKRGLSVICAASLALGLLLAPAARAEEGVALTARGWLETICAQLTGVADGDVTAVTYTGEDGEAKELTGEDFQYLVRDMTGGVRIDIPGVKPGTYSLSVTAKGETYIADALQVMAHDRSGYAHKVHDRDGEGNITAIRDYTQGVGAYHDDGTLKANARVLYVTEENKNTVTLTARKGSGTITVTGIGNILNKAGKANGNILRYLAQEDRVPLVVRIVGQVTAPEGLTPWVDSTDFPRDNGNNGSMAMMRDTANVTIEGIGDDACIDGWGVSFGLSQGAADGLGRNFEVRNLTFRNVPEDGVEVAGWWKGSGLEDMVEHAWVHNCAFYVPHIENPAADDKAEGDGAMDFKRGQYMTLSYNYFEDYHKTSIIGADDNEQYHVTWHHNHWKGCDQRCPLVREANVHIYNNLYEKNQTNGSSHCMGLRVGSYIFSEYNHFVDCVNAVRVDLDEAIDGSRTRPGACKSWQDVFENCTRVNNATVVATKDEAVPNSNKYPDFETNPELSYIPSGDYALDESIEEARANIDAWTGPMKALTDIVLPGHRHQWSGWQVLEPMDCTHTGRWTRTCAAADCPAGRENRAVPAVGHRYQGCYCLRCGDDPRGKVYVLTADQLVQDQKDRPTPGLILGGDAERPGSYYTADATCAKGGTEDLFSILYGAKSKLDPSAKVFEDGYHAQWRLNLDYAATPRSNAVQMELPTSAKVRVWWVGSAAGRSIVVMDADRKEMAQSVPAAGDSATIISQLSVTAPGTYFLGGKGGRNYIYKIEVTLDLAPDTRTSGILTGPEERTLRWRHTQDGRLCLANVPEPEELILAGCYDGQGRLLEAKLLTAENRETPLAADVPTVKLFWLGERKQPLSPAATLWGGE